jgi:hypothetical protein
MMRMASLISTRRLCATRRSHSNSCRRGRMRCAPSEHRASRKRRIRADRNLPIGRFQTRQVAGRRLVAEKPAVTGQTARSDSIHRRVEERLVSREIRSYGAFFLQKCAVWSDLSADYLAFSPTPPRSSSLRAESIQSVSRPAYPRPNPQRRSSAACRAHCRQW